MLRVWSISAVVLSTALVGISSQAQTQWYDYSQPQRQNVRGTLTKTTTAGEVLPIASYRWYDNNCVVTSLPTVHLDQAPWNGAVCSQVEEMTAEQFHIGSTTRCMGRLIKGIRLYYLSRTGFSGTDRFRYTASVPAQSRTIVVTVTVQPPAPGATASVPRDIAAPNPNVPQSAGPVPPCTALVS